MQRRTYHLATRRVSWIVVTLPMACATARLDPERNQAFTFDTTPLSDAGIGPQQKVVINRTAPSQPGNASNQAQSTGASKLADSHAEPMTCAQDPPDPKPTSTRDWITIEFDFVDGAVRARSYQRVQTAKPRDSARIVGRYAVELWIGCELIDRVRFNFPLQAAEPPVREGRRRPLHERPSLTANAHLSATVQVPFSARATRAELVDRGAASRTPLAWPPNIPSVGPDKAPSQTK